MKAYAKSSKVIIATLVCALTISCAHGIASKRDATITVENVEQSLVVARHAEQALYDRHLSSYGPMQHVAFLTNLDKAQASVVAAARALQIWRPGSPVPVSVLDLIAAVSDARALIDALNGESAAVAARTQMETLAGQAAALKQSMER
jgi:hypothetical protein